MGDEFSHTILLVDDEVNILSSLSRLFRKERHRILEAHNGNEALEILKQEPVSVIISDHKMPEMSGLQFLEKAEGINPDTIRIMLTGYVDIATTLDAINKGHVWKFVTKPWDDTDLLMTVRQAIRQYELVVENKQLVRTINERNIELSKLNEELEKKVEERTEAIRKINRKLKKSFIDTIRVFHSLMGLFDPELVAHSKRVAAFSREMAKRCKKLDKSEYENIELASLLHDIGLISIPKNLLNRRKDKMTPAEKDAYEKHTVLGHMSFAGIEHLEKVGMLVRAHHECFDGSGYPDGLKEDKIPLGARIISVADTYDKFVHCFVMLEIDALAFIKKMSWTQFDPEIVIDFVEVLGQEVKARDTENVLSLKELRQGMVLSRDIETISGRMLAGKDTVIKEDYLKKLMAFNELDPITDRIRIYRNPPKG
ncbi:MAG: HD domain-containing phosphohydrolase [Pseudomonadota bacterium]